MPHFICATCGVQYAESALPPAECPICKDERQYIGKNGQQWTTLAELQATHHNRIEAQEPNLHGIGSEPGIAIGQRALLVQTPHSNVLWDCITLIDQPTIDAVNALGGIAAIALSHPHYYSSIVEWSHAFGNAPIYIHADDGEWVTRPDQAVKLWQGETLPIVDGVTMIRSGGHFEGGSVLHWAAGAEGRGALLTGDIINVVQDRRYVTFMRSYPNAIPLSTRAVRRVVASVEPFAFERIYGAWWYARINHDAKGAVERSAERYIRAISDGTEGL